MSESTGPPGPPFRGYTLRRETWRIGGRPIHLAWPAEPDALLDLPRTRERFARDEYLPYWAQPWPVGVLLAEYLLAAGDGRERSAIELGCGIGLVSVAAALAGWRVTATDYDEDALAFADLNASLNRVSLAGCERVDFVEQKPSRTWDCVLAADLLYERRLSEPVAHWIAAALAPGGRALVGDPNRSAAEGFGPAAEALGLQVEMEALSSTAPAGLLNRGRLWRVFRD